MRLAVLLLPFPNKSFCTKLDSAAAIVVAVDTINGCVSDVWEFDDDAAFRMIFVVGMLVVATVAVVDDAVNGDDDDDMKILAAAAVTAALVRWNGDETVVVVTGCWLHGHHDHEPNILSIIHFILCNMQCLWYVLSCFL